MSGRGARVSTAASSLDLAAVAAAFAISLAFLLAPKGAGLCSARPHAARPRSGFGGARLVALNVVVEAILSPLIAPLIMLSHVRSLAAVLIGRASGWVAQAREAAPGSTKLKQALRMHALDTAVGAGLVAIAVATPTREFLWMSPAIVGLVLAIPLAAAGASGRLGRAARRAGLLLTPEERRAPQILARANALNAGWPPI